MSDQGAKRKHDGHGSWNHAVVPISAEEAAAKDRRNAESREKWGERFATEWECRMARACPERAAYRVSWSYITGRAQRVSTMEKQACRTHAERFAQIHELAVVGLSVP